MMANTVFSIAKDFSPFAGPRYIRQGSHSGEALRSKLIRFLNSHPGPVTIVLDGTKGMGSSFLDEVCGGLIRHEGWAKRDIEQGIRFKYRPDPAYISTIQGYIERADKNKNQSEKERV